MIGVSQQLCDNRSSQEKLEEIQKRYPINSYWSEKNKFILDDDVKHREIYHWVYGYEVWNKEFNCDVSVKTKIVGFTNKEWFIKNGNNIYSNDLLPSTKDEFEKNETNIIRGFSLIQSMINVNKLHDPWNFSIKQLNELEFGDKFLYFLCDSHVIRFGEMKEEFKASNGKFDDTYNSIMRQLTFEHKNDNYSTFVSDMRNWNINDKMVDYYIITQDYFDTLNDIYDDITFYYDSIMRCDTPEEMVNLRRGYQLDKILQ